MRFVSVEHDRFFDVMERCGGYQGTEETGWTHGKQLWVRNLSHWAGETVVGSMSFTRINGKTWYTYSIAGFLDDYYK